MSAFVTDGPDLPLTGERTVPGLAEENYWFRRHEVVYERLAQRCAGRDVLEAGCGEGYGAEPDRRRGAPASSGWTTTTPRSPTSALATRASTCDTGTSPSYRSTTALSMSSSTSR